MHLRLPNHVHGDGKPMLESIADRVHNLAPVFQRTRARNDQHGSQHAQEDAFQFC